MKRTLFSIFLAGYMSSSPAMAGTTPIKFSGLQGWRVSAIEADPVLKAHFGDSEYVILVSDKNAEELPAVRVRNLGDGSGLNKAAAKSWSSAIFAGSSQKTILTSERVFKKQGQFNYIAEFQTAVGTEEMLRSIVLGTVVDGKLYTLVYDQHREIYHKNLASVKKLFHDVILTTEK